MDESPGPFFPRIFAGSTLGGGNNITCTLGTIDRVEVAGNALGNIAAPGGGVEDVLVGNLRGNVTARDFIDNIDATGAIGIGGGAAVTIQTTGNDARVGFVRGTSINANITAGSVADRGIVEWVKTTSGSLEGSIIAQSVADPAPGVAVVDVAGSLTGSGITLAANGLQGQIIVNGGNTTGTWTGAVTVGGVALSPMPYYTNVSSGAVGGGAVGLAPFRIYGKDCVPENNSVGTPPLDNVLRVRWYGPLSWNPASGFPGTVEYRTSPTGSWTNITSDFTFQFSAATPRELRITPATPADFDYVEYRFTPNGNLKCAGVTGTPPVHTGVYQVAFD